MPCLDDAISTLTRCVFVAKPGHSLAIVDYAAVEARGVAWVAGEGALLRPFADPRSDVYLDMASRIFGRVCTKDDKRERFIGKELVLGCGYGMSASRFGVQCRNKAIDLDAAGTSAAECVKLYRASYPAIPRVWKAYEGAARDAIAKPGSYHTAGRCSFHHVDGNLAAVLPSGRSLTYRGGRIEDRVPGYCKTLGIPEFKRPTIVYNHPKYGDGVLYGALLCENIVQAVCRDLLATAIVRLEDRGYPVVLHVHDEVVCEVPDAEALRPIARIMSEPPPWATGFPIAVEGFTGRRYTKYPLSGAEHVRALNGVIL